jgi:HAD superfamily hydrolase (TIGR01509 family)
MGQMMMKLSFDAVIFDMDGVLVDSEPLYMAVERQSFAHYGIALDEREQSRFVGTSQQQMWREIKVMYGLEVAIADLIAEHQLQVLRVLGHSSLEPMPGVMKLIEELKTHGIPCALASSSPRKLVECVLERIGLTGCFAPMICGDEVRLSKPEPEIFLLAAARLGVPPHRCLVIEDSRHGVAAAKAAGMQCIGLRNPNSGEQSLEGADWRYDNHQQIVQHHLRESHVQG